MSRDDIQLAAAWRVSQSKHVCESMCIAKACVFNINADAGRKARDTSATPGEIGNMATTTPENYRYWFWMRLHPILGGVRGFGMPRKMLASEETYSTSSSSGFISGIATTAATREARVGV